MSYRSNALAGFFALVAFAAGSWMAAPACGQFILHNYPTVYPLVQPLPQGVLSPIDPGVGKLGNDVFYVPSIGLTGEARPDGVKVIWVEAGSAAEGIGLRPNDRISTINGKAVRNEKDFYAAALAKQGAAEMVMQPLGGGRVLRRATLPVSRPDSQVVAPAFDAEQAFRQDQTALADRGVRVFGQKQFDVAQHAVNVTGTWTGNTGPVVLKQDDKGQITGQAMLYVYNGGRVAMNHYTHNGGGQIYPFDSAWQRVGQAGHSQAVRLQGQLQGHELVLNWEGAGVKGDARLVIASGGTRMIGAYENADTATAFNWILSR